MCPRLLCVGILHQRGAPPPPAPGRISSPSMARRRRRHRAATSSAATGSGAQADPSKSHDHDNRAVDVASAGDARRVHYTSPLCGGLLTPASGKGAGPRLGKSGSRYQEVFVFPSVPGKISEGTHLAPNMGWAGGRVGGGGGHGHQSHPHMYRQAWTATSAAVGAPPSAAPSTTTTGHHIAWYGIPYPTSGSSWARSRTSTAPSRRQSSA